MTELPVLWCVYNNSPRDLLVMLPSWTRCILGGPACVAKNFCHIQRLTYIHSFAFAKMSRWRESKVENYMKWPDFDFLQSVFYIYIYLKYVYSYCFFHLFLPYSIKNLYLRYCKGLYLQFIPRSHIWFGSVYHFYVIFPSQMESLTFLCSVTPSSPFWGILRLLLAWRDIVSSVRSEFALLSWLL